MQKTTKILSAGYAYKASRKTVRNPEIVMLGADEIESAQFQNAIDTIDGCQCYRFRSRDNKYYWQLCQHVEQKTLEHSRYDETDVKPSSSWDGRIDVASDNDFVDKPLPWQQRGLSQTATGYGKRLASSRCLWFNNRLHRVYVCCFSNAGTAYIESKGRKIIVG